LNRDTKRNGELVRRVLLAAAALSLGGCTRAPSVDILGSFFPAWLLCLVIAIILTVFVQLLLARFRLRVAYPILFFISLTVLVTFALWLAFFH
jgi:hypothetical protein